MPHHTTAAAPWPQPRPDTRAQPWRTLTIPLAPRDTAVLAPVRALAKHALTSWRIDEERIDSILVVLSELVTNALVHTDGPAELRVTEDEGHIRVAVSDAGHQEPDLTSGPEDDAEHGFGLALIASTLADELCWTQQPTGKTVTARFIKAGSWPR